ncbi:type II toxin-antitoxin system VapC family toxin [[Mycobacterium] vasticus]|uniref:Ribonuclease VapC n=1 Tax=[Mycobacterium] vasticus TaxID=2875777 RepID=A0ABU5Z285_9MYCO|nr:type II toxin-antitoxin system VapC family toxin [Mycolicibacter sp. MYC017]MEB3071516.1 type II toxin-antitoxin system VapC family toxin [Mycolicibacter sp. MYC017]
MIVLDTTVLVYAKGADHPFRDPCRDLIAAVASGRIDATTTPEAIQEFVHVRARRRGRNDAAALGRSYAELLAPLVTVSADDLERGLTIFETTPSVGTFDSVLAAVAKSTGATLVSADGAFSDVRDINHVVPDAEGIAGLLGEP